MLSKQIKKDAKILNEIFEIENNLKSYNKIENLVLINSLLFPIISTTLIFLIFNDFFKRKRYSVFSFYRFYVPDSSILFFKFNFFFNH